MLNCFYINGLVWIFVYILYCFNWSKLCNPLSTITQIFFVFFILFSFLMGYIFRDEFKYKKATDTSIKSGKVVLIVIAISCIEFLYARSIPLLDALRGVSVYGEFGKAIPGVHTLLVTFCTFYCQYLFYIYISDMRKKKYIFHYIILLFLSYGLWFSRMGLFLNLFMSFCIFVASISERIKLRHYIGAAFILLFAMYMFGVLGNLRMGYAYNDNSLIIAFSRMNSFFPKWLPKQFLWSYIYIVGPFANFNYNVQMSNIHIDLQGFFSQFFPDMLSHRIFGSSENYLLSVESGIDVNIGYGMVYQYAGMLGVLIFVIFVFGLDIIFLKLLKKTDYLIPVCSILCAVSFFMFFLNSINYTPISVCLLYPLIMSRIKIRYKK